MPKLNLLNKIRKQQIKKRDAYKNAVWIIGKTLNDQEYYVHKADKDGLNNTVVWTNNLTKSLRFHTEKGCQQFAMTYLKGRSDVHLKWIEDTF